MFEIEIMIKIMIKIKGIFLNKKLAYLREKNVKLVQTFRLPSVH